MSGISFDELAAIRTVIQIEGISTPMVQGLPCIRCGDSLHPDTAAQNEGLCIPCVNGNTRSIEERRDEHRKSREAERAYRVSPEYMYWTSLVRRVYGDAGFDSLSHGDKLYYLLNILTGEVHNGGFDQFFYNSSGDRYYETIEALAEVGATEILRLATQAKVAVFGDIDVPVDRMARFALMRTSSEENPEYAVASRALDDLDRRFWTQAELIDTALAQLVETYGLYAVA